MNSTAYLPARQIDWITRVDLSTVARLVADVIDRAPRNAPEAWWGNARIADAIGYSVRTVQAAIRELKDKGLVAIVRDYSLKTRRRIVLLWRKPAEQPTTPEPQPEPTEGAMAHVPADLRLRVEPEPIRPAAAPAPQVDAARGRDEAPAAEGRKATPEEVERVVSEAAKVPGSTRAKAVRLAKACRLSTVEAAVRRAIDRGMGWGWVTATARAWAVEGVPGYAAEEEPAESQADAIMRLFGPGGAYAEPKVDMRLAGIFTYGDDD